jgi:protein phosphatase
MIEAFGASDPGCVRANNEDYFLVEPSLGLYLVADGMGGAQAGEGKIRAVATSAGFNRFRRATETPFNIVYEARP